MRGRERERESLPDLDSLRQLVQGLAGPRSKPVLEGPEATLVAEDVLTGAVIGCAQLGRIEVAKRIRKEYQYIAPTTEEAARPGVSPLLP